MKKIITIGGSNSKNSINKQLAEYAGDMLKDVDLIKVDLNNFDMPIYSIDIENEQGFSQGIKDMNEIFNTADGFVISLAEHNGAYSAAFKSAYDWLSRIEAKVWRNKPVLLLSTSPGGRGGQSVLEIALSGFPHMGANICGSMTFPSFYENFKEGEIVNAELKENLEGLVNLFEKEI